MEEKASDRGKQRSWFHDIDVVRPVVSTGSRVPVVSRERPAIAIFDDPMPPPPEPIDDLVVKRTEAWFMQITDDMPIKYPTLQPLMDAGKLSENAMTVRDALAATVVNTIPSDRIAVNSVVGNSVPDGLAVAAGSIAGHAITAGSISVGGQLQRGQIQAWDLAKLGKSQEPAMVTRSIEQRPNAAGKLTYRCITCGLELMPGADGRLIGCMCQRPGAMQQQGVLQRMRGAQEQTKCPPDYEDLLRRRPIEEAATKGKNPFVLVDRDRLLGVIEAYYRVCGNLTPELRKRYAEQVMQDMIVAYPRENQEES